MVLVDQKMYVIGRYYPESLFISVDIPYNRNFVTLEEILEMGEKITGNSEVQVCLLDYFPSFRRVSMKRLTVNDMEKARKTLLEVGLWTPRTMNKC